MKHLKTILWLGSLPFVIGVVVLLLLLLTTRDQYHRLCGRITDTP